MNNTNKNIYFLSQLEDSDIFLTSYEALILAGSLLDPLYSSPA